MRTPKLLTVACALALPCIAWCTTTEPGATECVVLDVVSIAARAESTRETALRLLEQMARGDGSVIDPSAEKELSLPKGYAPKSAMKLTVTRSCAIRSLGKTGLPQAVAFLRSIAFEDTAEDPGHPLWPHVQIALREAALTAIRSPQDRAAFLENVIKEYHDNFSNVAVNNWAIAKICDEGLLVAWPAARSSLEQMWGGDPDYGDVIAFYEARVQIASRDSNHARAIGSIFNPFAQMAATANGAQLLTWAVDTLSEMHTPDANEKLDRIHSQLVVIQKQFPGDAAARQLSKRIEAARVLRPLYNR